MIHVGDNTWNIRVFITDLQVEKILRVRGDLHIGGVMLRLVDPGRTHLPLIFLAEYCTVSSLWLPWRKNNLENYGDMPTLSYLFAT